MLEGYLDALLLEMQGAESFLMAMPAEERQAWEGLPGDLRFHLTGRADRWLSKDIPPLTASGFVSYSKAGIAADYQQARDQRRQMLCDLTLGSCVNPDGRYDMKLADVVWAICEESSWILPANNPTTMGRKGLPLPDPYAPRIDIGAAETASDLALTVQMAGARLDAVSPQLTERIEREIDRRITRPFLSLNDMAWMCGPKAEALPCLSGATMALLTFENNDRQRWQCMRKAWQLLCKLLEALPGDGSVPGGLEDWAGTCEPVMDMVMMALSVTRGRVDARRDRRIRLMCHVPVFRHMGSNYFANPGAHAMRPNLSAAQLFRLGDYIGDDALCELGACLRREQAENAADDGWLVHWAADIFAHQALEATPAREPYRRQGYFGSEQMMVARTDEDSAHGLALCAHGGRSGALGSHPDVGDVTLFCEGEPILVDAGFLEDTMFHNLPVIDGKGQSLGASFGASDVSCDLQNDYAMLGMELAGAYPASAGVRTWQRVALFQRSEGTAQIMDMFELDRPRDVEFSFMTPIQPVLGDTFAQLGPVRMRWDEGLTPRVDALTVPAQWQSLWGGTLYRLSLTPAEPLRQGKMTFSFNPLRSFG